VSPPETPTAKALRLRAADHDDLAIIAACLQDAIVMVGDMAYLPEDRRFVVVANRFIWEAAVKSPEDLARRNVGIVIEGVTSVRRRRIDLAKPEALWSLLSLTWDEEGLHLWFSGDGEVLLETDAIELRMEDIGEAWPAAWRPDHPVEES
jgi:hypothetical protein